MDRLSYIKSALNDYRTGAVTASSHFVVERVLGEIRPEHEYVVEYGPGDGVVTRCVLEKLPSTGRLIGVEVSDAMVRELKAIRDPRFRLVHDDVCRVAARRHIFNLPRVDLVISSIPFTLIAPSTRSALIANTHRHLRPGGTFLVYQYSPLVLPQLQKLFRRVTMTIEPRNLLPYFIMIAEK